jgi:RNA-binding protein
MLSSKQKKQLKGLAHALKPTVYIGKNGLDESVYAAVRRELNAHELIKVKLLESVARPKAEVGKLLAEQTSAELVTIVGKTLVLYKPNEERLASDIFV